MQFNLKKILGIVALSLMAPFFASAQNITVSPNSSNYWQAGLISYMGRVMYSYADKYMISAAVRSDASSRLAKGHQWHTYPAVSVGWNIHNEPFMEGSRGWLDELKLRVGYGETSNQAINPYQTLGSLGTRPYNFGETTYAMGYFVSTLPNTELGWEYSNTWNYGIDFAFLQGRLTGTVEYYSQKTHDILLNLNLPSTAGVGSYTANIGSTQNRGVEFSLNATIIDSGDWRWDAGINVYANRNKLVSLASGQTEDRGNRWFVGKPINCLYDYEYDGLWQKGEEALMNILQPGAAPGERPEVQLHAGPQLRVGRVDGPLAHEGVDRLRGQFVVVGSAVDRQGDEVEAEDVVPVDHAGIAQDGEQIFRVGGDLRFAVVHHPADEAHEGTFVAAFEDQLGAGGLDVEADYTGHLFPLRQVVPVVAGRRYLSSQA